MYDSLNPQPLPTYRIPVTITINDAEQSGYLRPVDNYDPPCTFMLVINDTWIGTLHHFNAAGWEFSNKDHPGLAERLGYVVEAWRQ